MSRLIPLTFRCVKTCLILISRNNIAWMTNSRSLFPNSFKRLYSSGGMFSHGSGTVDKNANGPTLELNVYETLSNETLENLAETLDELLEANYPEEFDVSLASGVLTIKLSKHGTYVLNKQTPNRQIWLSSPTSGPKRYDYAENEWIYSHDRRSLSSLLNEEFSLILNKPVNLKI